jgi:hypothetical protein
MPSSASCHILSNRKEKINIHLQLQSATSIASCCTRTSDYLAAAIDHRPPIWDKQEFFLPPRCSFKSSVHFHLRPHSHRVTLPFLSNPNLPPPNKKTTIAIDAMSRPTKAANRAFLQQQKQEALDSMEDSRADNTNKAYHPKQDEFSV